MSWSDNLNEKIKNKNQEIENKKNAIYQQHLQREKFFEIFWDKLLVFNSELDPNLRLAVDKKAFRGKIKRDCIGPLSFQRANEGFLPNIAINVNQYMINYYKKGKKIKYFYAYPTGQGKHNTPHYYFKPEDEKIKKLLENIILKNPYFEGFKDKGEPGSCFIASQIYGNNAHETISLQSYRDHFLAKSRIGRNFIHCYYRLSPPIANFIANKTLLKRIIKICFTDLFIKFILLKRGDK